MSWKGFTKALDRAGTSLKQTVGAIERTHDATYEHEERRIKTLETLAHRLHSFTKDYLNALRSTIHHQTRMAEVMREMNEASSYSASARYHDIALKLDDYIKGAYDEGLRKTVVEPVHAFYLYFTEINAIIKRRSKKLLDYDAARSKVKARADKPSNDPSEFPKLEQQSQLSKNSYEVINERLRDEIPRFIDLRVPYFDPSFEAMVRWQYKLALEGDAAYESAKHAVLDPNILEGVTPGISHELQWGQMLGVVDRGLDGRQEQVVMQLRQLQICNPIS